jgi:hypothetical protein
MHSWGYNLCPAREESRKFMLEYVREMLFEFYPAADGLLVESSDYAICYCPDCRDRFFANEFRFVRQLSDEVWARKPSAMVVVYPHYFSGSKVPGFDVAAAREPFDPRWTLFFTPHSAHVDTNLIAQAKTSILSTDALTLRTPAAIAAGARLARSHGINGYLPSLEPFSCVDGPPGSGKPRLKPFHFGWLKDGEMPLNELLMRVNRIAYREFTRDPQLPRDRFEELLGREVFGPGSTPAKVKDLLYLQETFQLEADWFTPSPILRPSALRERAAREKWPPERLAAWEERVSQLRALSVRYGDSTEPGEAEMRRIAAFVISKWEQ